MASRSCKKLDDVMSSDLLDSVDFILTDCDGVLWMGDDAIPGSIETLQTLHKMGKHIIYVTNNSTKSREAYLKKCLKLGFPATINNIVCTSYCCAAYLKSKNFQKKVYVFGSSGILEELQKVNIDCLPIGPDPVCENWVSWANTLELDPDVGAVIVGFDHHVSYPKLTKAASYLKNPDVIFLASNRDEQFPFKGGLILPGSGTFVHAVEVVCGRRAISLGKPDKFMIECIQLAHPDIDLSRTLMIGDRLNTDILLGTKHGIRTLFVETGINSIEDVRALEMSEDKEDLLLIPDYYLPKLGDLLPLIKMT